MTGYNEAFVIDGKKRAELISADPKSEDIIKPFLRGRDVKRWQATHADKWLIKIESSANFNHPWTKEIDPESVFKKTYPAVCAWLMSHRTSLMKRDDRGTYFWELRSCAYWDQFDEPKVIYPNQCSRAEFHFEKKGVFTNKKAFILNGCEPDLASFLNSNII